MYFRPRGLVNKVGPLIMEIRFELIVYQMIVSTQGTEVLRVCGSTSIQDKKIRALLDVYMNHQQEACPINGP
jgi:hypothetical protein